MNTTKMQTETHDLLSAADDFDIPVRSSNGSRYSLTPEEKAYIAAGADENGIIPIDEYIRRYTVILNSCSSKGR